MCYFSYLKMKYFCSVHNIVEGFVVKNINKVKNEQKIFWSLYVIYENKKYYLSEVRAPYNVRRYIILNTLVQDAAKIGIQTLSVQLL